MSKTKLKKFNPSGRFGRAPVVVFALLFAAVGVRLIVASHAAPISQAVLSNSSSPESRIAYLDKQLELGSDDIKHNPNQRTAFVPKLQSIARQRKAALLNIFETDPAMARGLVLPSSVSSNLAQNSADVEQAVTLTGKYGMTQVDNSTGDHLYRSIMTSSGQTYNLDTEQAIPKIAPNDTITVSGQALDNQLLVNEASGTINSPGEDTNSSATIAHLNPAAPITSGSSTSNSLSSLINPVSSPSLISTASYSPLSSDETAPIEVTAASTTSFTTTGNINDVIILANFTGSTAETPVTLSQVEAAYTGTPGNDVADYLSVNSEGKATLSPNFVGPFNISSTTCGNQSAEISAMQAAATAANVTLSNYEIETFFTNCNDGNTAIAGYGTAYKTIYISDDYSLATNAHELMHTMNPGTMIINQHGSYLDCAPQVFVAPINPLFSNYSCVDSEYQDPYDVLGGGTDKAAGMMSTYHRLEAGWLNSTQVPIVNTPGTNTYTLSPVENNTGTLGLEIPRGNTGSYITVEYRQPIGFDSYINNSTGICPYCNASQGALLELAGIDFSGLGGGSDDAIIDTTPGTHAYAPGFYPSLDGNDGTLLPGQSFTDPEFGFTIKTISATSSALTVQVTIPTTATCSYAAPTISPVSPSTQTLAPGQTGNYSFTVTSNDSSACNAHQYEYNPGESSVISFAQSQVSITASPDVFSLAPGASTTVNLKVQSTSSAPTDTYFSNATYHLGTSGSIVSSALGTSPVNLPSFNYILAEPSDTTPPSTPTNLAAKSLGATTVALSWNASTDNINVAGYQILVNGSVEYQTTGTSFVAYGLLPNTAYSFGVEAFDNSLNYSAPATVSATTPPIVGTTLPSAVGNLSISTSDHSYTLSWSRAYDTSGIACYFIMSAYSGVLSPCIPSTQTTYTINNVEPQTGYSIEPLTENGFKVEAVDINGNTSLSPLISATTAVQGDSSSPSQPQQVYVTGSTTSGSTIAWQPSTDSSSPITSYIVYRGCCEIAKTNSTTNTYYDPNSPGNEYTVQAVAADGSISALSNGFWSTLGSTVGNTSSSTTPTATLTSPTSGTTLSGSVTLQSSASSAVGIAQVNYLLDGVTIGNSTSGSSFPLTLNTAQYSDGPHWLLAQPIDKSGSVGASSIVNVTFNNTGTPLPTPPSNNNLAVSITTPASGSTVNGTEQVTANVTDSSPITSVVLQVDGKTVATNTTGSSPYSFTWNTSGLTNGSHNILVQATDNAGNTNSAQESVTVANADTTPPSAPTNLASASTPTYNQVNLSWTASTDNVGVAGYYVLRSSGGSNYQNLTPSGINATTYPDNSVNASTTYSYEVEAYDAAGNVSTPSSIYSVTTPVNPSTVPPAAPTNVSATAVSASQINLGWTASTSSNVTGYNAYYAGNSTPINGSNPIPNTSTSYGVTGLSPSTSYSFYVEAVNSAKLSSSASNTAAATTQGAINLTITSPANSVSVSGSTPISGVATDNDGATISQVVISVDNSTLTTLSTPTYLYSWNTANIANGTHSISVKATDSSGNTITSSVNVTVNNIPPSVPGTPSTTTPTNSTSPVWSWSASTISSGSLSSTPYNVEWSQSSSFASGNNTSTSTTSSFTTPNLTSGTWYFRVSATSAAGISSAYSPAGSVVIDTTPPTVSISAPAGGSTVSASVSITATVSDTQPITSVQLYIDGSPSTTSTNTSSPYGFTWNTSGLTNGSHNILVQATDNAGNTSSAQESVIVANADTTPPSAPTGLTTTAPSTYNQVNLGWTASTDNVGVVGYYVLRSSGGSNYQNLTPSGVTTTSYPDSSVAASTTYSYEIEAYDAAGNVSTPSSVLSITTPANPSTVPPAAPTNLSATDVSASQINLSWTASTSSVAGYDAYYSGSTTPINATLISKTSTTYGVTGLNPSTNYSFYVKAVNATNTSLSSSASNTATATTQATVTTTTVTGLVTANTSTGPAIANVLVYASIYGTNGGQAYTSTTSSGHYTLSGLTPNKARTFTFYANGYKTISSTNTYPAGSFTLNEVLTTQGRQQSQH